MAGLSRSGPALSDIQIRDKVKEVRRIDKQDTRRTEGGLITVEVGSMATFRALEDVECCLESRPF